MENKPKKVTFKGETYWLDGDLLCPLDHFTDEGEFCARLGDISYAVIEDGKILRFRQEIGTVEELTPLTN